MTAAARVRVNGCQGPWTWDQSVGVFVQPLLMAYFIVMYALFSHAAAVVGLGIMALITMFLAMVAWILAAVTDPGVFAEEWERDLESTHYCAVCRKQIPGQDHHCKWLGTCVGSRNYAYFYWLVSNAACSYTLQIATYFVILAMKHDDTMPRGTRIFMSFFGMALCAAPWLFYASLTGFHTYLVAHDMTTRDWLYIRAQKRAAERRRARAENERLDLKNEEAAEEGANAVDVVAEA